MRERPPVTDRIWLDTDLAADRAGRHRQTVIKALAAGELHGTQRKPKGRWRMHVNCVDAWVAGDKCPHGR